MEKMMVLYDPNCGFCRRCRAWLENEPAYFELKFLAAASEEATRRLPGIEHYSTSNELTVVDEAGAVYQGPQAFIMCLYALVEYREWSMRLAEPALLPFARQMFDFVSTNRKAFSKWFERAEDREVAATLAKYPSPSCGNSSMSCLIGAKRKALSS